MNCAKSSVSVTIFLRFKHTILPINLLKGCREMKLNLLSDFENPNTNYRVTLRLMKKVEHLDSFPVDLPSLIIFCVGSLGLRSLELIWLGRP